MSLKKYRCANCGATLLEMELIDGKILKKCNKCKVFNIIEVKIINNNLYNNEEYKQIMLKINMLENYHNEYKNMKIRLNNLENKYNKGPV